MTKTLSKKAMLFVVGAILSAAAAVLPFNLKGAQAASFNQSNIIADGVFVNVNSMDTGAIQRFLQSNNSYLKDFSENGRSAAQIIYDAAHGANEAAGSINGITVNSATGTVNPQVILVTLQKEQSLISRTTRDDNVLRKAMGYGCPDSGGCNARYAGFTKQVENAAWQLRYNFERARGYGFEDYQVGQSFSFDDWNGTHTGTFGNRATASLYRYTPHVYNGNYNFWNLFFNTYKFDLREYYGQFVSQTASPTMYPSNSTTLTVRFRNTGTATWTSSGATPVALALDRYWASSTMFRDGGWLSGNRIVRAAEGTVSPGDIGTFTFRVNVPGYASPGSYRFHVRLVADGAQWFDNPDTNGGAWWTINVPGPSAVSVGQSSYVTAMPGQVRTLQVTFKNTGRGTWTRSAPPLNLALDKYQNEGFMQRFNYGWNSSNRIASLPVDSVAPGQTVTFNFNIKIPSDLGPGSYRFNVRLVQDGYAWCEPDTNGGAWWAIDVPAPRAEFVNQSYSPTLSRGEQTELSVRFRNTSGTTWKASGASPVALAVDKYWADETAWRGPGWLSANRIVRAEEGDVAPGAIGTFKFIISVPTSMPSGRHQFFVRLVADGYAWFENPNSNGGAWWWITVR